MTFRQMIEKEGGKVLGNETFLGKECIVVELGSENGKMKMLYYKGMPLRMEGKGYKLEAVKIEENIDIPEGKFDVPAGITVNTAPEM